MAFVALPMATHAQDKPRVFITDSNSWATRSAAGGSASGFGGAGAGGARPQTAEIIKTFGQRCPDVIINNRVDVSDYIVELDHEGGKGFLAHKDKIAVFVRTSGDSIFSRSTLSVGGSVQDACKAILDHWGVHQGELKAAAAATEHPATASLQPQDQASVAISSNPSAADIEIDGNFVGDTPSTIQLTPGEHKIAVSKKGFQEWQREIKVTGGQININAELDVANAE